MPELEELSNRIGEYAETVEIHSERASILVLLYGGRVLGVDIGKGNLLWVNPNIDDVLKKREWNTGGIRTWISPERTYFYDDPEEFKGWRCPKGIDPANFKIVLKEAHAVELESTVSAKNMASGQTFTGKITKRIELAEVRQREDTQWGRVRIHDHLTAQNFESPFALWTILQVPLGDDGSGAVNIPVAKNAQPIHYFDPIPSSHLAPFKDRLSFRIDGEKELKLGVRPEDLPNPREARLTYVYKRHGKNILISMFSRTGAKNQEECVDPAKSNPKGPRAVIQSYNSDVKSSGLKFGELEIQGSRAKTQPDGKAMAEHEVTIDFSV